MEQWIADLANTLKHAINRCHNESTPNYRHYGARGIAVCDEWRGPDGLRRFAEHVGPRPSPKHTIDRIDNERGHEPGNVRWATWTEQANNRRTSRRLTAHGETRTLAEWSRQSGIGRSTIEWRLEHGWSAESAVSMPVGACRPTSEELSTFAQRRRIAHDLGLTACTVCGGPAKRWRLGNPRCQRHWSVGTARAHEKSEGSRNGS